MGIFDRDRRRKKGTEVSAASGMGAVVPGSAVGKGTSGVGGSFAGGGLSRQGLKGQIQPETATGSYSGAGFPGGASAGRSGAVFPEGMTGKYSGEGFPEVATGSYSGAGFPGRAEGSYPGPLGPDSGQMRGTADSGGGFRVGRTGPGKTELAAVTYEAGRPDISAGRNLSGAKGPAAPERILPEAGSLPIGPEQLRAATRTLQKYKSGKARLEKKLIAGEQYWKLRQWQFSEEAEDARTVSTPWLWTCIQSRHSDVMDSYPAANILPRQSDDEAEARMLSAIIPVIMEQTRFEKVYSDVAWYALKHGGGIFGVFWDGRRHNGVGDIVCRRVDFMNLFWEPGITDIQQSANVFSVELVDNDLLYARYPELRGRLGGKNVTVAKYLYDDTVDTSDKTPVVDWYYHRMVGARKVLHYCKYVADNVLYSSENDVSRRDRGWYDHGLYPFVTFPLYPVEGSLCGYGLTDIGKGSQRQIDELNRAIMDNARAASKPRYFSKINGGINEKEFMDGSRQLVHVEGSVNDDNIRQIQTSGLPALYHQVLNNKIEELKYCTSNMDSNNGVVPGGVTAASAISAIQETAGKNSRDSNKTFYRAYRDVIYQVIELVRQFYDVPRTFRLCPEAGQGQYVQYSNSRLKGQSVRSVTGQDMGLRLPEFDIVVTAEKNSPYRKMERNELALNFFARGFFNPEMADQTLGCLAMMDFDGKEEIISRIDTNQTLARRLALTQKLLLQLATQVSPEVAEKISRAVIQTSGGGVQPETGAVSSLRSGGEHPFVTRSRAHARDVAMPQ